LRPIFSRPCGTGRPFKSNPGLASWAKFSRPYGTRYRDGRSHAGAFKPNFLSTKPNPSIHAGRLLFTLIEQQAK
jgi:hypothetical protein